MLDKLKQVKGFIFIILILTIISLFTQVVLAESYISLKVREAAVRDVLLMLSEQSGINLVPDKTVEGDITINLEQVTIEDALELISRAYNLNFKQYSDNIYLVSKEEFIQAPEISIQDDLLTFQVNNYELKDFLYLLSLETGIEIIVDNSVSGVISMELRDVPIKEALLRISREYGLSLRKQEDNYKVIKTSNELFIVYDGKISFDLEHADLEEILRAISRLTDINIVFLDTIRESVNLKLNNYSLNETISILLRDSQYTYVQEEGKYLIGSRTRLHQPLIEYQEGKLSLLVENMDIRFLLREISQKTEKEFVLDRTVTGNITLELKDISLEAALIGIARKADLSIGKKGDSYWFTKTSSNISVLIFDEKVSLEVEQARIQEILQLISYLSEINLVLLSESRETISMKVSETAIEKVIELLLAPTSLMFSLEDGNYLVGSRELIRPTLPEIELDEEKYLTVDVENIEITALLVQIANKTGVNIFIDQSVSGDISIKFQDLSLDEALSRIAREKGLSVGKVADSYRVLQTRSQLSILVFNDIISLDVEQARIDEIIQTIFSLSEKNMALLSDIRDTISLKLTASPIDNVLDILLTGTSLVYDRKDNNYLIGTENLITPFLPELVVEEDKITIDVEDLDIKKLLEYIASETDLDIKIDSSVTGTISINLESVSLEEGLVQIAREANLSLGKKGDQYHFLKTQNDISIIVLDDIVSLDVEQTGIDEMLRTIFRLGQKNMVLFSEVRANLTLKLIDYPFEDAVAMILAGTRYTFNKQDKDTYIIGSKDLNTPSATLMTVNKIIPLQYIQAAKVPPLLPRNIPTAEVKVMEERNSLLITGTHNDIAQLEKFIKEIDQKTPQIIVEALILELSQSDSQSPTMKFGMDYEDSETVLFDSALGRLTYKSVLRLPRDFNLRIQSLVEKGEARIKARPNITTMSGQQASINVGTTVYYRITDTDSDGEVRSRFQSINTGITLQVTPWVAGSGEITLELSPSVNNIASSSPSADHPPSIGRREVSTTVRVQDGQTIVIGGLIQEVENERESRVPVLSRIPLLGRFFRSTQIDIQQTEMVIYITPHILDEDILVEENDYLL